MTYDLQEVQTQVKVKDDTFQMYPFKDLSWQSQVERFGAEIPEKIIDRSMGLSKCTLCKQVYSGYQAKCVKLRWGYRGSNGWSRTQFGHKFKGEWIDTYDKEVGESQEYECEGRTEWNLSGEFSNQYYLFSMFDHFTRALDDTSTYGGFNLTRDQKEKLALHMQIDLLRMENHQMKQAITEIVNRLNQGGAALAGRY